MDVLNQYAAQATDPGMKRYYQSLSAAIEWYRGDFKQAKCSFSTVSAANWIIRK